MKRLFHYTVEVQTLSGNRIYSSAQRDIDELVTNGDYVSIEEFRKVHVNMLIDLKAKVESAMQRGCSVYINVDPYMLNINPYFVSAVAIRGYINSERLQL